MTKQKVLSSILALAITVGLPTVATALMPPHVTKVTPGDGGKLDGDTVLIEGYSLGYAGIDRELKIVDTTTGTAVSFTHALACTNEGNCGPGSPPGACQDRCTVKVTLSGVAAGQRLKLTFLRADVTFEVTKAIPARPAP